MEVRSQTCYVHFELVCPKFNVQLSNLCEFPKHCVGLYLDKELLLSMIHFGAHPHIIIKIKIKLNFILIKIIKIKINFLLIKIKINFTFNYIFTRAYEKNAR